MGGSRSDFCFRHFLCNKIKSPTPDPSPVGRGVDTVVSCALLQNVAVGGYGVLAVA